MIVRQTNVGVVVTQDVNGFEPLQKHRFALDFVRAPSGLKIPQAGDLAWLVRSIKPPGKMIEIGQYEFMNRVIQYPKGRGATPNAVITLWLFCGQNTPVYNFFYSWIETVHNELSDEVGLLTDGGGCGGTAMLYVLDPDGNIAGSFVMDNMWPFAMDVCEFTHDADGSEPASHTISFVVNSCFPNMYNTDDSSVPVAPTVDNPKTNWLQPFF
jgi:hypothetical protein